jgi:hypothetical protein
MIWASCIFDGSELNFLPVPNPGACKGKTWLIEFVGPVPILLVVEAESVITAIEVLNSDPEWGDLYYVHVQDDEFREDSERMLGTQNVRVHGHEDFDQPYPVRYHDDGYPAEGIDPRHYAAAKFN